MHIKYIKRNSLKEYFSKLFSIYSLISRSRRGRDRMVVEIVTTYTIIAYPYHTDVVSSNLDQGEVYNIM